MFLYKKISWNKASVLRRTVPTRIQRSVILGSHQKGFEWGGYRGKYRHGFEGLSEKVSRAGSKIIQYLFSDNLNLSKEA